MSCERLVLTAVGPDRPGLVETLTGLLVSEGFNLEDSRMAVLGGEFAILILVAPRPDYDANQLPALVTGLEQATGMNINCHPTSQRQKQPSGATYQLQVHAMDHPGIVHRVAAALASKAVNIVELETSTVPAPVTGTPLFEADLQLAVPEDCNLEDLRALLKRVGESHGIDILLKPN